MKLWIDNLLIQFSVASMIILAAIAVSLGIVLSNKIREDAIAELVHDDMVPLSQRVLNVITSADFDGPMTGERYAKFNEFVRQAIVSERTAGVKLWSKDGTLIYSDDPVEAGNSYSSKTSLQRALNGETPVEINDAKRVDDARERRLGAVIEVSTPMIFPGTEAPQGVFEIDYYYAPTARRISEMKRRIFALVGGGFSILYVSLVSIVWRGWNTITGQRRQLASVNDELLASVDQLSASNDQLRIEITDRQKAQEALRTAHSELEIKVQARTADLSASIENLAKQVAEREQAEARLEHRAIELAAVNKELESFSYSVSHDLRAPLRSIDGFGQALLEDYSELLDAQGKDYLQRMRAAAQTMGESIGGLLKLSQVTRSEIRRERVDLSALVQAVAAELQATQPLRRAEFVIQEGIIVNGDPQLLRVVLDNLLSNAWKFTESREPTKIEFGVTPNEAGPAYFVRDNGVGFDMAYVDKLFGAFQRLHAVTEFEGMGIGLATVKRIVHRHGGEVWAEGETGEGATFCFTLI